MGKDKSTKGSSSGSKKDAAAKSEEGGGGKLSACNHVKARHILCEKQTKLLECYDTLHSEHGDSPPVATFGKLAEKYSECSSAKKGGDLGWFPRGKMVGEFQTIAFATPPGKMSAPFKTTHGYHIILVEGRKN